MDNINKAIFFWTEFIKVGTNLVRDRKTEVLLNKLFQLSLSPDPTLHYPLTWMWFLTAVWVSWVVSMAQPAKGSTTGVLSSCRENPIWPATSVASYEMLNMVLST